MNTGVFQSIVKLISKNILFLILVSKAVVFLPIWGDICAQKIGYII